MTESDIPTVIELRVHGVHGTPPSAMLGEQYPRQFAGDDVARFFRRKEPVLTLGKEPRSRVVEAFHWGRFTAGSPSRALWLVLIPFSLVNLARYALLLPTDRTKTGRVADAVLRLLGVVLTVMLVSNAAYVGIEILMHQCADSAVCLQDNSWLRFLDTWPAGLRLLVGAVPALVVVTLLWWFGRQSFLYEPPGDLHKWRPPNGTFGDHAFWHTSPKAPVLRAMHTAAASAALGLMFVAFLNPRWDGDPFHLTLAGAGGVLLLVVLYFIARGPEPTLRTDPNGRDAIQMPKEIAGVRWLCVLFLVAAAGVTVGKLWTGDGMELDRPLAGFEVVTNIEAVLAMVLLVALLVVCILLRWQRFGRDLWKGRQVPPERHPVPKAFRPLWFGFGAWVIATLGTLLALGFSGGVAFRVADLLGRPVLARLQLGDNPEMCGCQEVQREIQLGASYWIGAWLWGVLAVLILLVLPPMVAAIMRLRRPAIVLGVGSAVALAALVVFWTDGPLVAVGMLTVVAVTVYVVGGLLWNRSWTRDGLQAEVRKDYENETVGKQRPGRRAEDAEARAFGKAGNAWRLALTKYRYHWLLGVITVFGGLLLIGAGGAVDLLRMMSPDWRDGLPQWLAPVLSADLGDIGAWTMSGLVGALVFIGLRSWRGEKMRTTVGVLWDLVAFWPRLTHPICPPPYGGRATLELAYRANSLVKQGCEAVVLSGHSQGSLVCAAAVSVLDNESRTDDPLPDVGNPFIPKTEAEQTLKQIGLVTYGSQLQWAYPRIFPSYIGFHQLETMWTTTLKQRWWNVFRWTDPLGGPVLSWPNERTPWPTVPLPEWTGFDLPKHSLLRLRAGDMNDRAWGQLIGHDVRLRDPEFVNERDNRPKSPLRGHGGYYDDPVFDEVVANLADQIRGSTG
jgi:hypothetical protein